MGKTALHVAACLGAMAAAGVGFAGIASAAPTADSVVNGLQAEGYVVQINQTPTAPLTACTVTNVAKAASSTVDSSAYVDIACPTGC